MTLPAPICITLTKLYGRGCDKSKEGDLVEPVCQKTSFSCTAVLASSVLSSRRFFEMLKQCMRIGEWCPKNSLLKGDKVYGRNEEYTIISRYPAFSI